MLKLSTKGRYGLRAMLELADAFGEGPVMMSSISRRQGLSRKYLHALLTALKDAGLVRSLRGAKGGYVLTRAPETIRVSEIFVAMEGTMALVDCVRDPSVCTRSKRCTARKMWKDVNDAMASVLENVSLSDLLLDSGPLSEGKRCTG
jgi:Rrf2 family transcriptional regulator, cysteine metabolism repressor